jgi:hypothetical protein
VAPAKSGEPAAIPAGQAARLGQGAHLGATATGVEAEGRPARWGTGGQARWPRRLGENGEEARCWATSELGRFTGG